MPQQIIMPTIEIKGDPVADAPATVPQNMSGRLALALVPTVAVSFKDDPLLAWGRLALYGTVAYLAWGKIKPVSYAAIAAGGVALLTSLSPSVPKGA